MVRYDKDRDRLRVIELDIIDNSYRYLTEWCEMSTSSFDMAGNTLYYRLTVIYEGQSFFRNIALDVNTLEERIVANHVDGGYVDYFYYLKAYDGDSM